jgi:hypothetical protein
MAESRGDGSHGRVLAKLAELDLLAIDVWLLTPLTDAKPQESHVRSAPSRRLGQVKGIPGR